MVAILLSSSPFKIRKVRERFHSVICYRFFVCFFCLDTMPVFFHLMTLVLDS